MSTELDTEVELYDSDVLAIEGVVKDLNQARQRVTTVDSWRNEIINRFAEINLRADVVLRSIEAVEDHEGFMHTPDDTRILTTITIKGRIEQEAEFDHDKMAHEVRANIRGLNQPTADGAISVPVNGLAKKSPGGLYLPPGT